MDTQTLTTLDCGHAPTDTGSLMATGVAHSIDDQTMCYACADQQTLNQVADSSPGDRVTLYLSSDGHTVTTWSSGVIMRHVRHGENHPFSHERFYIRATDEQGRVWSGVAGHGMWTTLRLTRQIVN